MTRRMREDQQRWALTVILAVEVSLVPHWHDVLVAASSFALVPFNALWSHRVVARLGPALGQGIRSLVNFTLCAWIYHLVGWPPAAFLWLPFVALAPDESRRDIAYGVLAFNAIGYTTLALLDGVSWHVPLPFLVVAILCRRFTDARVRIAHDLWRQSDAQHEQLKKEVAIRERVEIELRQVQKLEAIGRLAAGIAHEINNPLQFVDNSAQCVFDGVADIARKVDRWRKKLDEYDIPAHVRAALDEEEKELELPALRAEVVDSLHMLQDGVQRVTAIVHAMQQFADPDHDRNTPTDLNRTIEATLVVSRQEYAEAADMKTELSTLPEVSCHSGAISQVLLNLLVNAAQAITARHGTGRRGTITVRSTLDSPGWVRVSVADDGIGIPVQVREKVFEPFFTTRGVGSGRGQGLSVARSIVEGHGGQLTFETEVDRGTTFTLRLPLTTPAPMQAAA